MDDLLVRSVFYIFACLALITALLVITQNNPVRCVLFLVVTFFATAVLWILVSAEFLALILVLVYVGAVMTLFLFVVMMLNIDVESIKAHLIRHLPFGLILVALLTGLLLVSVPEVWYQTAVEVATTTAKVSKISNTEAIGMALFTDYVFAFELAAILLLTAIVAAITLTHRDARRSKQQNVVQQIMTERRKRVTLVSMPAERPNQETK